jgi:hypothetical protein
MTILVLAGLGWVGFSILLGLTAAGFGRSGAVFFLLSLVVSPLLAAVLLVVMGPKSEAAKVRCSECGALAKATAQYCPGCGRQLPAAQRPGPESAAGGPSKGDLSGLGIVMVPALTFFFALLGATIAKTSGAFSNGAGLLAGAALGAVFSYGTKRAFPEQMTN